MSTTIEIPRTEWRKFLDEFSLVHLGWLVSVEVLDSSEVGGVEVRNLALEGVSADLHPRGDDITITVAAAPASMLSHHITAPEHIYLKQNDEGADETLCVTSAEGPTTLVTFRAR